MVERILLMNWVFTFTFRVDFTFKWNNRMVASSKIKNKVMSIAKLKDVRAWMDKGNLTSFVYVTLSSYIFRKIEYRNMFELFIILKIYMSTLDDYWTPNLLLKIYQLHKNFISTVKTRLPFTVQNCVGQVFRLKWGYSNIIRVKDFYQYFHILSIDDYIRFSSKTDTKCWEEKIFVQNLFHDFV